MVYLYFFFALIISIVHARSLSDYIGNNKAVGVYFQSWSSAWASSGDSLDLAKLPSSINIVYLSFVRPGCSYTAGSSTLAGTGLDFSSDFGVVKSAIQILRNRGVVVMLSVGGATYGFESFNAGNLAALARDLGANGIDIDWEDSAGASAAGKLGPIIASMRAALPDGLISMAGFSVGAYGSGEFENSPPASANTGMCVAGLKSNGNQLDWINLMSYDASPAYDPKTGFNAYRSYYNGPILIGEEVPPEAWGGNVISLDRVKEHARHVVNDGHVNNGIFVWSYQKQGTPSSADILTAATSVFNNNPGPTPTSTPVPTPQPGPNPTPAPRPTPPPPSNCGSCTNCYYPPNQGCFIGWTKEQCLSTGYYVWCGN